MIENCNTRGAVPRRVHSYLKGLPLITVIDREKSKASAKTGSSVFLLFSGIDHEFEGNCINFEGVYNSLFIAKSTVGKPYDNWEEQGDNRHYIHGGNGHVNWAYCIIECKIGEICDIGLSYGQLFDNNL